MGDVTQFDTAPEGRKIRRKEKTLSGRRNMQERWREREREREHFTMLDTHIVRLQLYTRVNAMSRVFAFRCEQTKMAARVGVSKHVGESSKGRRRAPARQTSQCELSVKDMSEELEKARQNEVSMRNKLHAVSESHT